MITFKVSENSIDINDAFSGIKIQIDFRFFTFEHYQITVAQTEAYLDSLVKHITYVRDAGDLLGVDREQLEVHDLSKFSLEELPYYVRNFQGDKGDPDGFALAWLHHLQNNHHHWQHYIFPDGFTPQGSSVENGVIKMPVHYVREMLADWMGANMTYDGSWDMTNWLVKSLHKLRVHSQTEIYLRQELDMMGYADVVNGDWKK